MALWRNDNTHVRMCEVLFMVFSGTDEKGRMLRQEWWQDRVIEGKR